MTHIPISNFVFALHLVDFELAFPELASALLKEQST